MADVTLTIVAAPNGKQMSAYRRGNFLDAPTGLTANVSGSAVSLSWTNRNNGVAPTIVQRSSDNGATWTPIVTKSAGVSTHNDTSLANGNYDYRVQHSLNNVLSAVTSSVDATVAVGGAAYAPLKLMSFEGGTVNTEATGANGFETCMSNTLYSSAVSGPLGGSRVCKIEGLNAGGTVFGGLMVSPDVRPSEGSDCWVRIYHYFPSTFCFQNNGGGDQWGQTKWIRFQFGAGGDRLTFQMGNYSASVCNTNGLMWGATTEGNLGTINHEFPTQISIPRGGWRCLEWQVHFSTNPANGYIRGWVDGEYAGQVTCKTMADTGNLTEIIYGDYINGGHILNNPWYIDEAIITFETPDSADSGSRPFIGTTRQTGDF